MTNKATARRPASMEPLVTLQPAEHPVEHDLQVAPRYETAYRVVQDCSGAVEYEAGADFSEFYG